MQTAAFATPRQIMVSEATRKFQGERVPTNTLKREGQSIKLLAKFFQEVMNNPTEKPQFTANQERVE